MPTEVDPAEAERPAVHAHHRDPARAADRRHPAVRHEPLPGRRRPGHAVRAQQAQDREQGPAQDHVRRRRRRRRGDRGAAGGQGVPAGTRRSSRRWAPRSRAGCCCSARPAPARRCSLAPSPARRACRSSRSAAPTSSRCSWGSAPRGCATCSSRRRRRPRRSCSSTRSTRSGRQRGAGLGGGHDEREQTLNQLLVEMDGFDQRSTVILMAATNRPDILDPALLRPGPVRPSGRDRPSRPRGPQGDPAGARARQAVRRRPSTSPCSRGARPGSPAPTSPTSINEAALLAARRNKRAISMKEIEEAVDRVMAGPERKSRVMDEEERRLIAYHEGGHAMVAHVLPNTDEVHKITVIPRGRALGYTLTLPEQDKFLMTREQLRDELAMLMGGRVAEEIVAGDVTTGAGNDIERATKIAHQMVTEYGMSDTIGPRTLGQKQGEVFLGRDWGSTPDYSDAVAFEIDLGGPAADRRGARRRPRHPHREPRQARCARRSTDRDRDDGSRGGRAVLRRHRAPRAAGARGALGRARGLPRRPSDRPRARAPAARSASAPPEPLGRLRTRDRPLGHLRLLRHPRRLVRRCAFAARAPVARRRRRRAARAPTCASRPGSRRAGARPTAR